MHKRKDKFQSLLHHGGISFNQVISPVVNKKLLQMLLNFFFIQLNSSNLRKYLQVFPCRKFFVQNKIWCNKPNVVMQFFRDNFLIRFFMNDISFCWRNQSGYNFYKCRFSGTIGTRYAKYSVLLPDKIYLLKY